MRREVAPVLSVNLELSFRRDVSNEDSESKKAL